MDNFAVKLDYLFKHQKSICPICGNYLSFSQPLDLHHKMSKSKWALKKYPNFIHSILNLVLLHSSCHLNNVGGLRITPFNAERYENFLKRHKKLSEWLNNPCNPEEGVL